MTINHAVITGKSFLRKISGDPEDPLLLKPMEALDDKAEDSRNGFKSAIEKAVTFGFELKRLNTLYTDGNILEEAARLGSEKYGVESSVDMALSDIENPEKIMDRFPHKHYLFLGIPFRELEKTEIVGDRELFARVTMPSYPRLEGERKMNVFHRDKRITIRFEDYSRSPILKKFRRLIREELEKFSPVRKETSSGPWENVILDEEINFRMFKRLCEEVYHPHGYEVTYMSCRAPASCMNANFDANPGLKEYNYSMK